MINTKVVATNSSKIIKTSQTTNNIIFLLCLSLKLQENRLKNKFVNMTVLTNERMTDVTPNMTCITRRHVKIVTNNMKLRLQGVFGDIEHFGALCIVVKL